MLTLHPRELHETLERARAAQKSDDFKERYKLRAGVEGTINQALDVAGVRRARYRGLPKVRLQHAFSATAINIVRLDAYWSGHLLDRNRTSRLTRLSYQLGRLTMELRTRVAVRRASREDPAVLNPSDQKGHWHSSATTFP